MSYGKKNEYPSQGIMRSEQTSKGSHYSLRWRLTHIPSSDSYSPLREKSSSIYAFSRRTRQRKSLRPVTLLHIIGTPAIETIYKYLRSEYDVGRRKGLPGHLGDAINPKCVRELSCKAII